MNVPAALARCALFQGFGETGLLIFAHVARERRVAAGAPVFSEGQPGESLFVVVSGALRIVERDREVAVVGEGEHVGALSILAPGPRLATAVAAADSVLLELGARDFARLQPEKPKACLKLALAVAADVARRAHEARAPLLDARARAGAAG